MSKKNNIQKISVIVPKNPFVEQNVMHCLTALDVEKLMLWWPGKAHTPHRDPQKVLNIQRFLDWKRVVQIAAYLLQKEITDVPKKLNEHFREIYEPKKLEPGREWPPKVSNIISPQRSRHPTFSNVLLHVNGAKIELVETKKGAEKAANLIFDERDKNLRFTVIDGQHRINGAYLALKILQEEKPKEKWEIPAEIFLDLDKRGAPPRNQAQIFIDVNFYQKKVDRSLVADLFPTARGERTPIDDKERSQDVGRKLMLEVGPLVGMIQIPGIKFGVKDVVTLATLNSAIENILEYMIEADINSLEKQTEFLAQSLDAWLEATGRKNDVINSEKLDPTNVTYQGRILVSFLNLLPACIWLLKEKNVILISDEAKKILIKWLHELMKRASLLDKEKFITKDKFKKRGYLGSGGIGRFRNRLWATIEKKELKNLSDKKIEEIAKANRSKIYEQLAKL